MAGAMFRLAHRVVYPGFMDHYARLMKGQTRPREELVGDQVSSLRAMLMHAYDKVPYYHGLLKGRNLRPDDFKAIEDLERLPVLTKDVIKANWEALVPLDIASVRYERKATGGSTGTPFPYRMSRHDKMLSMCHLYRGWSYAGYQLGDRMVFMGGSSLTMGAGSAATRRVHEVVKNIRMLSSFDMDEAHMRSYADTINRFRPRFVFGYASSISFFSRWLKANGVQVNPPVAVFATAEKLFPEARKGIAEAFRCEVLDTYGLNDGGVSAFECLEHRGMHVDTERAIMEVVDADGRQLAKGEGRILATSLHNQAMPFIRYDTGDIGRVTDELCPCGRQHPLLEEIKGREQEMLMTPEGAAVHGEFFTHIFWEVSGVKEFQVVQDAKDHLTVRVVPEKSYDPKEMDKVRDYIRARSPGWKVDFQKVDAIDRTRGGKYRFVIREV
ncbi:MAG: phenylacetate--CoA ligase family protein [Candidatus Thermoplasmatota archaeon]